MRPLRTLTLLGVSAAALIYLGPIVSHAADTDLGWPEITRENKPWTRWWWPGSGVDKASLTAQLEKFAAAGIGGVEITPIYGAKGYEGRYIDFLSPKWMEMLEHTGREAQRLGLGVDMATGTGWPFGGPWIDEANANTKAVLRDGKIIGAPTRQMVKRAAPGDEGLVVDPYSPDALRRYLAPFEKAFANFPRGLVRGQFHDSFEYYGATWTAKLAEVFQQMHGYDIQQFAAELMDAKAMDRDTLARIKCDYRDTLAKLHLDYLHTWVEWSHAHGFLVRNQSHGAPGNLLDLYANADIPETEIFGSTAFQIPGLRREAIDIRGDQDLPESLVIKMASSAAHVAGHPYASSESLTWLREHFRESPSQMKPELDRILCDGINHIFYHGTVFSPSDVPWPGWLFYASTEFHPNNPLWDDLGQLNHYVARAQSVLQRGTPANDVLLYWPIEDIFDDADGLMLQLAVHNVKWLYEQPFGKIAQKLRAHGYQFDFVSDAQLLQTRADRGELATTGARYKVLLVPATRRMPVSTLQQLSKLAAGGATVIFEKLPEDVPGYGRLDARRAEFKSALATIKPTAIQGDMLAALSNHPVAREVAADLGISVIRRATPGGRDYFFANLSESGFAGWITLSSPAKAAVILDPLNGATGAAALRRAGTASNPQVYLQLATGQSLLLRTATAVTPTPSLWPYREITGAPTPVNGAWKIEFVKGGPVLPPALTTNELKSWTDLGGDAAKAFAGTARYRVEFDAPAAKADDWLLDLGEVREVARVRLNGQDVATAWSVPFRMRLGPALKSGRNVLEIDVTNLAANRIRDLDLRKVNWRIMHEINYVNINYRPFDASGWSLVPSGLLGPVTLTPLKSVDPTKN